ncbi:pre-mRNA-splicing factor SYF2 [Acrasis kona]|uniref:Pre-mRNA-splicing factor SYF2 n=1 Tax=Acrasis kona TaxID=1008807 RepID=A0AAW2Z7S9_9EUKA
MDDHNEMDNQTDEVTPLHKLDDAEVKRRLRLHQQPICYFGETEEDRKQRLSHFVSKNEIVDYKIAEEKHKSHHENFLQRAQKEQEEEEALLKLQQHTTTTKGSVSARIFNLRMKANKCRKQNIDEVVEEANRQKYEEERAEKGIKPGVWFKNKKQIKQEERDSEITAEQSIKINEKKSLKRKRNHDGSLIHTDDALYEAYDRRLREMPYQVKQKMVEEYQMNKSKQTGASATNADLQYGQNDGVTQEGIDRMVNELEVRKQKRDKFSRRREYNEDEDVTYINEFNRRFNKNIGKAFDKYTKEIRANLERGTAL